MTDSDLALAYVKVFELDAAFGEQARSDDADEAGRAVSAGRLTAPLKRLVEGWIARRACRAVLAKVG